MSFFHIPNFKDFFKSLNEKSGVIYDHGAIMAIFPIKGWEKTTALIAKEDLYTENGNDFGIEDEPHVSVLLGIHDWEVLTKDVVTALNKYPAFTAKFTKISLFENEKFDVVKFDVECPELHKIHEELKSQFPNTSKFPDYKPHLTIAFVKAGEGKKYVKTLDNPIEMKLAYFEYSKAGQSRKLKIKTKELVEA
jgi:hypothetical protein